MVLAKSHIFSAEANFFWLKWPLYGSRTPEMDSSTSQWCTLSGFWPKIDPKNRRENRGERRERSFGRFHSGGLRRIYRALLIVSGERRELHDFRRRHFSRISMGMRENLRNRTKQTQKWPKKWYFGHFWPLRAVLEALKTPYRCELKSKLVKLFMGHILKAFRAKKLDRVGRGVRNQFWGRSLKMTKSEKIWSLVATCSEGPLRSI